MTEFIITCQSELQKDGSYKIERYRELVRCKDCKYHGNINEDYCRCLEQETNDDFFCWYGERKDNLKATIRKVGAEMDMEKVIEIIKARINDDENDSEGSSGFICVEIDEAKEIVALLKEQPQIVRCKDCKYRIDERCYGILDGNWVDNDWFCADGERRTDDA